MPIVTRSQKGLPLTHIEMDNNFNYLNEVIVNVDSDLIRLDKIVTSVNSSVVLNLDLTSIEYDGSTLRSYYADFGSFTLPSITDLQEYLTKSSDTELSYRFGVYSSEIYGNLVVYDLNYFDFILNIVDGALNFVITSDTSLLDFVYDDITKTVQILFQFRNLEYAGKKLTFIISSDYINVDFNLYDTPLITLYV